MKFLKTINEIIKRLEKLIIAYGVIIISAILIVNVFTRQFLDYSWKAAEETSLFFVVAVTFLALSYAARTGKHIVMTAVLDIVPFKVKKVMMIVNSLLSVVLLLWIASLSWEYVMYVKLMGRFTPALEVPAWMTVIVMPIGFFLAAVQYAITFILNIKHKDKLYMGSEDTYGSGDIDTSF